MSAPPQALGRLFSLCVSRRLIRQELADYLCVDRSAMSAELSRMQDCLLTAEKNMFALR